MTILTREFRNQATKRAAAAFFFEMLVLGSRDCVKVKQQEAYGSISIAAKSKLWNVAANEVY